MVRDMGKMRLRLALALLLGAGGAAAETPDASLTPVIIAGGRQYMTGAEPISPEEYDRLPKLGTFRAWLPKKVDLTLSFPKPGDQGREPNCTAWATTYAGRSFLYAREIGHQPSMPSEQMSPAYVYNRLRPPGSACDRPVRMVDALNLLQNEGTVTLSEFPDDPANCNKPAPAFLKSRASNLRLAKWSAIARERAGDLRSPILVDDIKGALSRAEPVVFVMPVMDDWIALKGDAVYTHPTHENTRYHAMALVGYDEDRQAFRVINSWGQQWGDGGYAWIGYDTFKLLATEAYALEDAAKPRTSPQPAPVLTPKQNFDALLGKLPCGTGKVTNTGGHLAVSGFGGSQETLDALHNAALALDPGVHWDMAYHPWPQCEGELTLANPLAAGGVGLLAQTEDGHRRDGDPVLMHMGETFGISAETSAGKPYLSLIYLQADGSAVELYNGKLQPDAQNRLKLVIGTGDPTQARFQVGPPYGNEMVIAIASAQPFWGSEIQTYATERQFLTALRARLTATPEGTVSAAVLRILTKG